MEGGSDEFLFDRLFPDRRKGEDKRYAFLLGPFVR